MVRRKEGAAEAAGAETTATIPKTSNKRKRKEGKEALKNTETILMNNTTTRLHCIAPFLPFGSVPKVAGSRLKSCCIASVKNAGRHSCSELTDPSIPHRCTSRLNVRTAAAREYSKDLVRRGREA